MRIFTAAIGVALLAIAGSVTAAGAADAQYPARAVRVVVPFVPGVKVTSTLQVAPAFRVGPQFPPVPGNPPAKA